MGIIIELENNGEIIIYPDSYMEYASMFYIHDKDDKLICLLLPNIPDSKEYHVPFIETKEFLTFKSLLQIILDKKLSQLKEGKIKIIGKYDDNIPIIK